MTVYSVLIYLGKAPEIYLGHEINMHTSLTACEDWKASVIELAEYYPSIYVIIECIGGA